jgi:hypothetical protein
MEQLLSQPQDFSKVAFAVGRTSQLLLGLPFDVAREHYARAVRFGFIQQSMLANAKFEQSIAALEKLTLGPWARQV